MMREHLDSSMKKFSGWNINYYGKGEKFVHHTNAKIIKLKQIIESNYDKFNWIVLVDSNDILVNQNYNEDKFIQCLNFFDKPIIFCGEANNYPFSDFEAFYESKSSVKYLNSGFVAMQKDFSLPLINKALDLYEKYPRYKRSGAAFCGDQTYYQLCLFSKGWRELIAIDDIGKLCICTCKLPEDAFHVDSNGIIFKETGERPFMVHFPGMSKHDTKRNFMKKMGIRFEHDHQWKTK